MEWDFNIPTVYPSAPCEGIMTTQIQIEQRTLCMLLLDLHSAKALHSVGAHLVSVKEAHWCFDKTMYSADRETQD